MLQSANKPFPFIKAEIQMSEIQHLATLMVEKSGNGECNVKGSNTACISLSCMCLKQKEMSTTEASFGLFHSTPLAHVKGGPRRGRQLTQRATLDGLPRDAVHSQRGGHS